MKYVVPDVVVEKVDGEYQVVTNEGTIPRLMVSSYYMSLAKKASEDAELSKYLSDKYNSAMWLIKSTSKEDRRYITSLLRLSSIRKNFWTRVRNI